jgi:hypothetical protein
MNLSDFLQGYGAPLAGAGAGAAVGAGLAQLGAGDIEDEKVRRRSRIKRALIGAGLGGAAGAGAGVGVQALLRRGEKGAPVNAGVNQALPEKPVSLYGKEVVPLGKDLVLAKAPSEEEDWNRAFGEALGEGGLAKKVPLRQGVPTVIVAAHGGGYPGRYAHSGEKPVSQSVERIKEALRCVGAKPGQPFDLSLLTCNRQGGLWETYEQELKKQGLQPGLVERAPAYGLSSPIMPPPVFNTATGKPVTLRDYVQAGKAYHLTARSYTARFPAVVGGLFNREVATRSRAARELQDIADKWQDPVLFAGEQSSAGYKDQADFAKRWQEMLLRYAQWLRRQKPSREPAVAQEPTGIERPPLITGSAPRHLSARDEAAEVPAGDVLGWLEDKLRFLAKPKMAPRDFGRSELIRGKSDLGYGLPEEERARIGNMLRLVPVQGKPLHRLELLESSMLAADWLKRGVAEFTPGELEVLRKVLPRYDKLRQTLSAKEAIRELAKETPEAYNLIRRAIETGHILAQTGGSAQELPA